MRWWDCPRRCEANFRDFDIDVLVALPGLVRSDDLGRHLLRQEGRYQLNFAGAQLPEEAADVILTALRRNKSETPVGWQSRWIARTNRYFPRLVDRMLARKVRQLYESRHGQPELTDLAKNN